MQRRRFRRRRPSRCRRAGARRASRTVEERERTGQPVADRPARRHQEQPRRHRRKGSRRKSGTHDDHGRRLRVFLLRGSALRAGDRHRDRSRRGPVAVRHAADGRARQDESGAGDQGRTKELGIQN